MSMEKKKQRLGIDVGSTTVKVSVLEQGSDRQLFEQYERHHAEQGKTVLKLLKAVEREFPGAEFRAAVCGSGGRPIAERIGAYYIQEVVANAALVRALYPQVRTAIELGGQDAKIIFFHYDEKAGRLIASDMRMNGSCAGGTGAFVDEIASLLNIPTEDFEKLAAKGQYVHSISGRCGVFAKTDIQSVLNEGGRREDIALSTFHAIVKQTVGGLAQGLELKPPILFAGGPLTFNPTLVKAFAERLSLRGTDIILPEGAETIVARGTAIAMEELFEAEEDTFSLKEAIRALECGMDADAVQLTGTARPYFDSDEACSIWRAHHASPPVITPDFHAGETVNVYIGIDAGSTTSKLVLMDEREQVIDRFYANNQGEPVHTVQNGLLALFRKYEAAGVKLHVLGLGTTGYGELLLGSAFGADFHTVETVAHAAAAQKYVPDVSFLLDIGGQDMKAIWISGDIVTDITLNEACSSGCGSFLENFAVSLGIPVEQIADAAFRSGQPADLGSRCTVFMNIAIITEQKNGRSPDDIMAGLCRSIIENVFTKVVRISNPDELGKTIVAQGGTFQNDAVLRALEQYLGREVHRAPYPGEMGCIGAALLTKRKIEKEGYGGRAGTNFIGFSALPDFDYTIRENLPCKGCTNQCSRTVVEFSSGARWVTGNKCERGAWRGTETQSSPDLFLLREKLLFREYPCWKASPRKGVTIGLPRTLEYWDSMPFWTTFFRALGFDIRLSHPSTRALYEKGIPYTPSDTVCFPAKLSHGHIHDLAEQGVDRIFMPMVMEMPPDDKAGASNYVCAVLKGYPLVISHSENPEQRWNVKFDFPMFHWHTETDRKRQICDYMQDAYGISRREAMDAYWQGAHALQGFRRRLADAGAKLIREVTEKGGYAVVLAGRPYHTDPLVSHDLSRAFTREGVPVLTVDALPGLHQEDLRYTRAEVTNNFHTRMLEGASLAAKSPVLEYVQIVSFGCGHDAILSDEIIRIMKEVSGKAPLILKLDEGGAANSLHIRVKSFLSTVSARREKTKAQTVKPLPDAYPVKFEKPDKALRTVLVPNVSPAFCRLLSAVMAKEGLRAEPLPTGGIHEIHLGKKYVHNDTCFPAQMVIGEAISALQSGKYPRAQTAVAMAKYQGDCRLAHYPALLRRALDAAGFTDIPIVSTDPIDSKEMHPSIRLGNRFQVQCLWAISIMDILEELRRKIRPYELHRGETDRVFEEGIGRIAKALGKGVCAAVTEYRKAIEGFRAIPYDRSEPKPQVFVTGEYLVTFHPGSNFHIEAYLEKNGMEVILPRMINVFRKDYLSRIYEMEKVHVKYPASVASFTYAAEGLFRYSLHVLEREARKHPLYVPATPLPDLAEETEHIMNRTFLSGEGWLIPGEIREYALRGVTAFVILQPFGCMPNHICGRGMMKKLKEEFPSVQILPLDLEPDTSFANVENRLQMLIMNEKSRYAGEKPAGMGR